MHLSAGTIIHLLPAFWLPDWGVTPDWGTPVGCGAGLCWGCGDLGAGLGELLPWAWPPPAPGACRDELLPLGLGEGLAGDVCWTGMGAYPGNIENLYLLFTQHKHLRSLHTHSKGYIDLYHKILSLTLSSIYTHFNILKKKALGKHWGTKWYLLKMSNFTFFHNVFYGTCILKPLKATFQLSSAVSLNLGRSQNGVLGNRVKWLRKRRHKSALLSIANPIISSEHNCLSANASNLNMSINLWFDKKDKKKQERILITVFLQINTSGARQNIDREPLFCTQFAKQNFCPILFIYEF